jgi:hypothetical protein
MESIPSNSKINLYTSGADFSDCFSSKIPYNNQSALDLFLIIARETPAWVNRLMSLRNQIVSKLGLKNLGHLADIDLNKVGSDYQIGERVGIFTLHTNSHHEVILEDQDKHLGVKISFYIEPDSNNTAKIYVSSVVHENNLLGKVYMFFVAPVHKKIVPATLKTLAQNT